MATLQDCIDEARYILQDESGTPRFVDAKMVLYGHRGVQKIWDKHPEATQNHATTVYTDPPDTIEATTDTLRLTEAGQTALIHYLASRCFGEDTDDDANLASAAEQLQHYEEALS
jgi:hypothetical protein